MVTPDIRPYVQCQKYIVRARPAAYHDGGATKSEARDEGIIIHWVKVRGHSGNTGNDSADKAATWGQNGGSKNVENLRECMEWLLASTQNAEDMDDTDN